VLAYGAWQLTNLLDGPFWAIAPGAPSSSGSPIAHLLSATSPKPAGQPAGPSRSTSGCSRRRGSWSTGPPATAASTRSIRTVSANCAQSSIGFDQCNDGVQGRRRATRRGEDMTTPAAATSIRHQIVVEAPIERAFSGVHDRLWELQAAGAHTSLVWISRRRSSSRA